MRADRLRSLLMLLQARGRMTAQELARELEVSERTIYRDINALSASGVPVYAESGPGGGCALLDSYRTNLTGLTADEVRALFMRSKARDVYDIWLLTSQSVQMNQELIRKKLALHDVTLSEANLKAALEKAKADWTRDLKPLLPQFVTWKDAMTRVASVLNELVS